MVAAGAMAVGAIVGVGAALMSTIGPASDLNETVSKVQVVFGENAAAVIHFGQECGGWVGHVRECSPYRHGYLWQPVSVYGDDQSSKLGYEGWTCYSCRRPCLVQ